MWMMLRHLAHAATAARFFDQITESVCCDSRDYFRLGNPYEWIHDIKPLSEQCRHQDPKTAENLWMRGSARACADDLSHGRKVQAQYAILEKLNVVDLEQPRHDHSERDKQE